MAVSSVGSSRSIYGNRNVLTGLASGLDTESMIENAISAYKNKITALTQKRTKTEWKQEAYRSIIDKMSVFADKYTSYRSANNLMSSSFFDQAVKTTAKGKYADMVTATGRSSSDIQVDRVRQLASSAVYKLSGSALDGMTSDFGASSVTAAGSGALDLDKDMELSKFSGSMTLAYGGQNALSYLTIDFDETKTYKNAQELADEINKQLEDQTVNIGTKSYTGKDLLNNVIKAVANDDGTISFSDPKKNNVYISNASDSVKKALLGDQDLSSEYDKQVKNLFATPSALETKKMSTLEYLSDRGASMEITLDGTTRTVDLPSLTDVAGKPQGKERNEAFIKAFQKNIDKAFGEGKLTVSNKNSGESDKGIQFQFTANQKGSTFSISSDKGEILGFGESKKITSYLNTGKTLGDLLKGKDIKWSDFEKATTEKKDANGNTIKEDAKDANGKQLYNFKINGKVVGQFNEDTDLSTVFNAMNSSSDSEVKVGYSRLTNELTFTAKNTGAASKIEFEGLSAKLFGAPGTYDDDGRGTYTKGQDAILEVSVNGTSLGEITRSSNSVELDGMTINLKGTFGYETNDDGSVKLNYSQKEENGKLLFEPVNGVSFYGEKNDDGEIKLVNKSGAAYQYSSSSNPDLDGADIYARVADDGSVNFYAKKNGSDEEVALYAQKGGSGKGVWFSVNDTFNGQKAESVRASMNEPTANKVSGTEPVTFETTSDADKIVDAVKQMVEDYNAMATEIKNAYSTLPLQRSNKQYYEPLTEEDEEGMTESAIKAWQDKAKTGILFGESDLRNLYNKMTSAVSMTGEFGATLRAAGITVEYSNGLSTMKFDEDKFRNALNNDPDKVRDAFVSSTESGAKSNGLMQALKQPLDMYAKTSGGKGILVEKAGSLLAPSTLYTNNIQKELNNIDKQIEKWQDKMEDQIDSYTSQFSRLEQLIQQMNSQSSYFAQLTMGG